MPATTPLTRCRVFGMVRISETQCVEIGDRPRTHREDIAHDAANAGGGALIGFDVAWVVVAFHLEDGAVTIAEVDNAGVFPRTLDDLRPGCRQLLQPVARRLIGAVLGPHDRENAEFRQGRLPAHNLQQALVFVRFQSVVGHQFSA